MPASGLQLDVQQASNYGSPDGPDNVAAFHMSMLTNSQRGKSKSEEIFIDSRRFTEREHVKGNEVTNMF